jgi:hydrogenase maturation protease
MSRTTETPVRPARREQDHVPQVARTLVLGLGNPLLADDSVGLRVVERLRPLLAALPCLEVAEDYWGGLRLMERLVGFERAVIIDAQYTGATPGTVRVLSPHALSTRHGGSAHDADLLTALELGRRAGAILPATENIRIVAVEAADVETFCEDCTAAVAASIPTAAQAVLTILEAWR